MISRIQLRHCTAYLNCPVNVTHTFQDIGPEANVSFTDHVFLDKLTRDFPRTGAARNFIDLVVNGLSRNPDMSVEEKKNYIVWYKDYLTDKKLMGEAATKA